MSRIRIEHRTTYYYQRPVSFGRHRLVLRPREGHDLNVETLWLEITPAHRLVWARDVYNNSVAIVDFTESAAKLEVTNTVVVKRTLPFPRQEPWEPWRIPLPVSYDVLESPITQTYHWVSYPDDLTVVNNWLRQFPEITGADDAEAMLMALCTLIHTKIRYQRRDAKGVQTPGQTLSLGTGSCRDVATLMMDAARAMGLSARFVSGYLDCPASEAGRAAMHAWTEVYLPILGWRGFDPTLGEAASLKHIAVGVSLHPRGVMPVSGMYSGTASDHLEMTASVKIDRLSSS